MKTTKQAENLLNRMNKSFSDSPYTDMPMEYEGTDDQKFRAREGNESINNRERKDAISIELTRMILAVDHDNYDVDSSVANSLASYIERSPESALKDLKMELGQRIKDFAERTKKVKAINPKDYETEIDFIRAQHHEHKKLEEFENRLEYLSIIVRLMEAHNESLFEEREREKKRLALDDFDFSFVNTNGNHGYQHLG